MDSSLKYFEILAGIAKDLFKQWDAVESVAINFIQFLEKISLEILKKF